MIDLKRFVDINIIHREVAKVNSIRDTAVLLTTEYDSSIVDTTDTYSSLAEFVTIKQINVSDIANSQYSTTYKYVKAFFDNGGNKLRIIENITDAQANVQTAIEALPNEQIVVAYTGTQSYMKAIAQTRSQDASVYGINRKLLLMSVSDATDDEIVADIIYKYSAFPEDIMTIAAYLTNINIYGVDTVQDYCFTQEIAKTVIDDDTLFAQLSANNINVDVRLAGANRNYGGNCKNGLDLVNEFVLIVLQQTVTDRVILALTSKLKNEEGLAVISSVISEELNRYITNGYLNQSAMWTDPSYTVSYNDQTYTVVEQDTALPLGYRIKVLPYSSLTSEDKANRSAPPIYLAIADSYGIRKVTINGKVFE